MMIRKENFTEFNKNLRKRTLKGPSQILAIFLLFWPIFFKIGRVYVELKMRCFCQQVIKSFLHNITLSAVLSFIYSRVFILWTACNYLKCFQFSNFIHFEMSSLSTAIQICIVFALPLTGCCSAVLDSYPCYCAN